MPVSLYDVALFVHIAAAVHLIGTSLVSPAIVRRVQGASTRAELLTWLDFARRLTRGNPPTALVLLGTGIYLGSAGWWNAGWFYVSLFAWILSSVLAVAVIQPAATRIAKTAAAALDAPVGRELDALRRARAWPTAEKMMIGSDLAMLWIMVIKPGSVAAIAIFLGAMAVMAGAGLLLAKKSAPQPAVA